jgi:hypothetical protein
MVARVISFRIDDDVLSELEKRKLRDESVMLTAQRILSEALGIIKSPDYASISELVDTALIPIQDELKSLGDEMRSRLDAIEARQTDSSSSTLVQDLTELLDTTNYPTNGTAKLRKRIRELISKLK